ncbi:hypothetical protein TWF569_008994 [Orbilia oligospora]|uniref:Uncharacterized protein n=1 Tax=Orbilia oligospora TaxID=2813651 RepID=A0A7C8N781_ORBOL|nr:hypothetical protein TWF102_008379 [Orbilia oligospora]KAF3096290.1 hypothetical protein TWF103_009863 [Orbilia oligospora]KAF3097972.1 hypothetical protein TWF706_006914 [Orbilia oligospora]KAF3123509.1 hypothetical protein TWF703_000721 [Orbilia oligospora]KAF3145430.1 hypothetical protein TWF594_004367 [Orbilia oligospora]
MRFTAVILSFAALAAAQETVWVTETVIGTDCAPTGYPTTLVPVPPTNATTTDSSPVPTYVPPPAGNLTTTTGVPEYPTGTPTATPPPNSGAGSIFPASGFALAGAIAAIMAIVA